MLGGMSTYNFFFSEGYKHLQGLLWKSIILGLFSCVWPWWWSCNFVFDHDGGLATLSTKHATFIQFATMIGSQSMFFPYTREITMKHIPSALSPLRIFYFSYSLESHWYLKLVPYNFIFFPRGTSTPYFFSERVWNLQLFWKCGTLNLLICITGWYC